MTTSVAAPVKLRTEVWVFLIAIVVINFAFVAAVGEGWIDDKYYARGRLALLGGALVVVVFFARGLSGILELIKPLFVWRVSPIWFALAVLVPIIFAMVFVVTRSLILGEPLVLFNQSGLALFQRDGFLLNIFMIALIGEIVWVGYAIRHLAKFYSLQLTAIITGTCWALWWAPMMVYEIGIIPGLTVPGLWAGQVAVALSCTFFYFATRSGLVILAMQYCFNLSLLAFPVLPGSIGTFGFELYSVIYMALGLVAVTFILPWAQKRGLAAPASPA